jgi:hypothetical protein
MRSLEASLNSHPLAMLRGIAELRGVALTTNGRAEAASQLAAVLAEADATEKALGGCSPAANEAWTVLRDAGGRMKLPAFARSYGPLRPIGPGRLEREAIWRQPESPAEELWFLGLIFRGFTDLGDGLVEYVHIPDDLMPTGTADFAVRVAARPPGPAPAEAPVHPRHAINSLAVDACGLLASLRTAPVRLEKDGRVSDRDDARLREGLLIQDTTRLHLLIALAIQLGWVDRERGRLAINPRGLSAWLESTHWEQMTALFHAWRESTDRPPAEEGWNDLLHTPGLQVESSVRHEPVATRKGVLEALRLLEAKTWYAVSDCAAWIKALDPDFQRPDGDYQSWYLRDAESGRYLSGFESWEQVEGRLIHFLVTGPLFWLGAVALGPAVEGRGETFRLTAAGLAWLSGTAPAELPRPARLTVHDDFIVSAPLWAPLRDRYRLLRFTEPEMAGDRLGQPTRHRITRGSLAAARAAGLTIDGIQQFLRRAGGNPLPERVAASLTRWGEHGGAVRISRGAVLRVEEADILAKLRGDPVVAPLLGDLISAQAVLVSEVHLSKLLRMLEELGYIARVD